MDIPSMGRAAGRGLAEPRPLRAHYSARSGDSRFEVMVGRLLTQAN